MYLQDFVKTLKSTEISEEERVPTTSFLLEYMPYIRGVGYHEGITYVQMIRGIKFQLEYQYADTLPLKIDSNDFILQYRVYVDDNNKNMFDDGDIIDDGSMSGIFNTQTQLKITLDKVVALWKLEDKLDKK